MNGLMIFMEGRINPDFRGTCFLDLFLDCPTGRPEKTKGRQVFRLRPHWSGNIF
jgi:hypothetical protein